MPAIYLDPAQVPNHLKAGYTGKKFAAELVETVTVPAEAGLWSSGSRDVFYALDLMTGKRLSVTDTISAPWDNRKSLKVDLKSGFAVVRHTTFQGQDMGLTFYMLPTDAAPLLPPSADNLTETELNVLAIIRGLMSFARADEYRRKGISAAEVEAVKAGLIKRGYLNKAGAITTKGKNAVGDRRAY